MLLKILFCVVLFVSVSAKPNEITFKNVVLRGYNLFTYKFNVTIASSNSLKEHLPKTPFDAIEIIDADIPILYRNSISDIDNLDELTLVNDKIFEIQPGAFKNLSQLRKLVITNNILQEINAGVFNNLQIATLDLSQNGITVIEAGAFDDMPELLNVNLADNQINQWNENWFKNTPLLTRVSFQNNSIETLPANAFKNLQGTKQFGSVKLTINIVLSYNKINKIDPKAFNYLKEINHLWLDNNEINSWNENLLQNIKVADLRINDNKLVCLEGDLNKILTAESTQLDGNPWNCDCLNNILTWKERNGKDVDIFYSRLTCDAARIEKKLKDLEAKLKNLK